MAEEFARGLDERSPTASGSFLDASDFRMHNKVTTTAYVIRSCHRQQNKGKNRVTADKKKEKEVHMMEACVCLYMHTFLKKGDE